MTIYYIDSNSTLAGITSADGDTLLFKAGETFAVTSIPAGFASKNNIVLGSYGGDTLPIIDGSVERSDWTYDAGNDVYSRPAYASNVLGNVTEDGLAMKFVAWDTNIATTAALMTSGGVANCYAGSMTYDSVTKNVYIRPSSGTADDHVYRVSESLYAFQGTLSKRNITMRDLEFRGISRHGIVQQNKTQLYFYNLTFRMIGGHFQNSTFVGNAIEASANTYDVRAESCRFYDIFDSPVTSQLYETSASRLSGHLWKDLHCERFGMHATEVSVQTANQSITDIEIRGIYAKNGGVNNWSGDRNGSVVLALSNSAATGRVTRVFARNIKAEDCRRIYLGYQHGGLCGIEDAVGTGMYGLAATSNQGSGPAQIDLWRNVSDNIGTPSGGSFQQVTCTLSNRFRSFL